MFTKRKSSLLSALIFVAMTGSLLNAPASNAATSYTEGTDLAASMFDPLLVSNFSMQMSQADFDSLRAPSVSWDYEGEWRETRMSFTMADKLYGPYVVGVHLKGAWGSWRDVSGKAAFKIKMDAFVPGQKLFGLSRITLNNMVQDYSYLHESLTYRLFRNLGIPAPRTGYSNVSLNGISYGLHLNVETPNKQMLKRWGISSNHLYKGAVPYFPDFNRGSEWMFAIESGSETDVSDLTNLLEINQLQGQAWWNAMSKITNMDLLTLGWATELFTGHWDGYVMNRNNYFVNFDDDGKVVFLPWGVDQTWGGYLDYGNSPAVMTNKCWAYQPCNEIYLQSLAKVSRIAKNLDLQTMARNVAAAIKVDVTKDPFGPGINAALAYQSNLLWRVREQQSSLSSMVQPFDTTLASVRVDGVSYSPGQQIYLPAGTKSVSVQATTSQYSAKAAVQPMPTLKPGLNKIWVVVTSADRQHINTNEVNLYVYLDQVKSTSIPFHAGSTVRTFAGISNTGSLGTDLLSAVNPTLEIKMLKSKTLTTSKAKTLMNNRVRQLLSALSARGITPIKVTQTLISNGTANSLQVTARYQQ